MRCTEVSYPVRAMNSFLRKSGWGLAGGVTRSAQSTRTCGLCCHPVMNVLLGCDIYEGGQYNHFGFRRTGITDTPENLAIIEKMVGSSHWQTLPYILHGQHKI